MQQEISIMTNERIPSLTHDAEIAAMLTRTEVSLNSLLIVNDALSCLSQMACISTTSDKISTSQMGCLIAMCEDKLEVITDKMWVQLNKDQRIQSDKLK